MNVVLISRDHRLGAILTMALPSPERLTLLDSPAEVPDPREAVIDAVVLDLPADSRRDAYQQLRQRYEGRVVVPVDNAKDTNGWPPDSKRRFLVRPFQVADLIAGVQEPEETSVAERAARYRRLFRWNRQHAPAFPDVSAPPAAEQPPPAAETSQRPLDDEAEEPLVADVADEQQPDAEAEGPLVAEDEERVEAEEQRVEAAAEEQQLDDEDEERVVVAADQDEERSAVAAGEDVEDEASFAAETEDADEPTEAITADEDAEEAASAEGEADEATEAAAAGEPVEDGTGAERLDDESGTEDGDAEAETQEFLALDAEADEQAEAEEATEAEADEQAEGESEEERSVAAAVEAALREELRLAEGSPGQEPAPARPPVPPLPVQAGVAMAKAVALQQWLEAEEARRTSGRRRRVLANVAAGLVLLLAGVGIGMALGSEEPQQVSPPATPQSVVQIRNAPPPAACTQAMDNADAVISYLVAKIRDERLSESIQAYGANARACRRSGGNP